MRTVSILTKKRNIEHLHSIENFPVYMGCVSDNSRDIFRRLTFDICKDTGIIQLRTTLPLRLTNPYPHNDSVGTLWELHNKEFITFIESFAVTNVVELGGGSGKLAHQYLDKNPTCKWTIYDKNYTGLSHQNIHVNYEWFNNKSSLHEYDAVIHSHVFEHIHQPISFLKNLRKNIRKDGLHIFSVPNLYQWLKNKYVNCLNFEHTLFLTEDIIDTLLSRIGFEIVDKKSYGNHSIFYCCRPCAPKNIPFTNHYTEYKNLFNEFIEYYQKIIYELNSKIADKKNVYLFGAHIFSQYMLFTGLDFTHIATILDNSELKNKKRLYGTQFLVEYPSVLKYQTDATVILLAGVYTDEIKSDIISNINETVTFLP